MAGYRGLPPVNIDDIALTLIKISQMIVDFPQIQEIDINPLLADADGVIALDARIRVIEASETGERRLAIRPYPKELEETVQVDGLTPFLLRPIVPEDEPALQRAFAQLTPEETRMRFAAPKKTLPHIEAARFTQIDYDREMALVLTEPGIPGKTDIFGVVRLHADPDNDQAEFAIIVQKSMTGKGLGSILMDRIIAYARMRGTGEIFGYVLADNRKMLDLCKRLGFARRSFDGDSSVVTVSLDLRTAE